MTRARTPLLIADIKMMVARRLHTSLDDLESHRRQRYITRPRQIAMYLCRELTGHSLPEIGRYFGNRDHTTVLHAVRLVPELMKRDPDLAAEVKALRAAALRMAA